MHSASGVLLKGAHGQGADKAGARSRSTVLAVDVALRPIARSSELSIGPPVFTPGSDVSSRVGRAG